MNINIFQIAKGLNAIIGLLLIILGIFKYYYLQPSLQHTSELFIPFYLILYGVFIICFEIRIKIFFEYFKFLESFAGKGLFNIYVATLSFENVEDETPNILGFISSIVLCVTGVFYIFLYFYKCCRGLVKDEDLGDKDLTKKPEILSAPIKENELKSNLIDKEIGIPKIK